MLDTSQVNLQREWNAGQKMIQAHSGRSAERVERYHGPYFSGDYADKELEPENHAGEYIALMLPQCAFNNPRFRVSSRRGTFEEQANAMRHALNRWAKDSQLRQKIAPWVVDVFFGWGVFLTTLEDQEGLHHTDTQVLDESIPQWPTVTRVPPHRAAWDPLADDIDEARWIGHEFIRDVDDIEEEAKEQEEVRFGRWNLKAIQGLRTDYEGLEDREGRGRYKQVPPRHQVTLMEVFVPEYTEDGWPGEDEGYHGAIFTLSKEQAGRGAQQDESWIREARPFFGPRTGPYVVTGIYPVPDTSMRLSPLTAVEGQNRDLNNMARAITRSMDAYKRFILVDGADQDLLTKVKSSRHDFVVMHAGLTKARDQIIPVEIGGATDQMLVAKTMRRETLDRTSGLLDVQRGAVTGEGTATEVAIANQASSARIDYVKQQIRDGVRKVAEIAGYYMHWSEEIEFALGPEATQEMQLPPGANAIFVGGDGAEGVPWEDLELEIEPYSMDRQDDTVVQARAMQAYQLKVQAGQLMISMPWMPWEKMLRDVGNAMNMPDFEADIPYKDVEELGWLMISQGMIQPGAAAGESPQPLLAAHTGGTAQGRSGRPGGRGRGPGASKPGQGMKLQSGASRGSQEGSARKVS